MEQPFNQHPYPNDQDSKNMKWILYFQADHLLCPALASSKSMKLAPKQ